jgi:hypothetical protein
MAISGVLSTKIFIIITIVVVYSDYVSDIMAISQYYSNGYMMYFTIVLVGMFLERMMSLYMNLTTRLVNIKWKLFKVFLTFTYMDNFIIAVQCCMDKKRNSMEKIME